MDTTDPDDSAPVADTGHTSKSNQTTVKGYLLRGSSLSRLKRFSIVKSRNVFLAEGRSPVLPSAGIFSVLPPQTVVMRLGPISVIVKRDSPRRTP